MLNALLGSALVASVFQKFLFDWSWFYIYFLLLAAYLTLVFKTRVARDNGKRKTLMFASWAGKP